MRCRVKAEKALLIEALSLLRTIKEERLPCIAEILFQFIDGDKEQEACGIVGRQKHVGTGSGQIENRSLHLEREGSDN